MKTSFVIVVVVLAGICQFEAEATDCYRCSYTKAYDDLIDSTLNAALARIGIVNDATCQTNPSYETEGTCPVANASCGTVQATLSVNIKLAGRALKVKMDVFSRDCFPDDTNPGVDETTAGCYKADDYEDFFSQRFVAGLQSVQGLTVLLKDLQGCICFCDDEDRCNDQISLKNEQCFQNNDENTTENNEENTTENNEENTTKEPGGAVGVLVSLPLLLTTVLVMFS